jgi:hypothetical protein
MGEMNWIYHELERAESEINALCSKAFPKIEHHWTDDKEFVHELKGLVSPQSYYFLVEQVEADWQEFLSDQLVKYGEG